MKPAIGYNRKLDETGHVLDRRIPSDMKHVEKYRFRDMLHEGETVPTVETLLSIPRQYRDEYDQGQEGACVGFSQSWMMSILNRKLYDARILYHRAQDIDEWTDTPPEEGTSLRAGFDILRTVGHWRVYGGQTRGPQLDQGIVANRWAANVDEIRTAVASGIPGNFGTNWYRQFSRPTTKPRVGDKPDSHRLEYWIAPTDAPWGPIDGGHDITIAGASDRRQAFALLNTWGYEYPFLVWVPYASVEKLLADDGEVGIVTDR